MMKNTASILINGKVQFNVATSNSLFSILNENKIFLPSICGGKGLCGKCKCKVFQGGGELQPAETRRLSPEEIQNHFRLACQVKIEQDLSIEIPDPYLHVQEFQAKVALLQNLTDDIKLVRLKLVHPEEIDFQPGQYIQLKSNPYQNTAISVMRSYSIASPSWKKDSIDLMVRLIPEGVCSTWVHRHILEGDTVSFIGPRGDFIIREGKEDIVLVAGASGMAPMVSILEELSRKTPERSITYFFGACKRKDLFFLDEIAEIGKKLSNFSFTPVLSEPDDVDACQWESGLVTEPLKAYLQDRNTLNIHLYLCGSPGMVQSGKTIAMEKGVPERNIFHDPFR